MEFEIRLFATLKDRAGSEWITVAVEPAMESESEATQAAAVNVKTLLAAIGTAYPALVPALNTSLVAVNKSFAFAETAIEPGDEIALFPPVSGGADEQKNRGAGEQRSGEAISNLQSPISSPHPPTSSSPKGRWT